MRGGRPPSSRALEATLRPHPETEYVIVLLGKREFPGRQRVHDDRLRGRSREEGASSSPCPLPPYQIDLDTKQICFVDASSDTPTFPPFPNATLTPSAASERAPFASTRAIMDLSSAIAASLSLVVPSSNTIVGAVLAHEMRKEGLSKHLDTSPLHCKAAEGGRASSPCPPALPSSAVNPQTNPPLHPTLLSQFPSTPSSDLTTSIEPSISFSSSRGSESSAFPFLQIPHHRLLLPLRRLLRL